MSETLKRIRPVLILSLALGLGAAACGDSPSDVRRADSGTITTLAANDGLKVIPEGWVDSNAVAVAIDLGSCTLQATAVVEVDNDYHVTALTEFDYSRMDVNGDSTDFRFHDKQELEDKLLGPQPCRTLATQSDS